MNDFIKKNYHTHTWRCQHASGTERQFVEMAIENGIEVLGFSDHVPCPFSDGFVSHIRMTMEQAPEYVSCLKKLQEEYRGQIAIKIGYEMEYIPEFFEQQIHVLQSLGCDYLIMGQHFLGPENRAPYTGSPTGSEEILNAYVNQVLEGAATGQFLYIAHPDLMHYTGSGEIYRREMRRMCQGLKQYRIPLEINGLGMSGGRHYPNEEFWKLAGEVGNEVVIGMDAHTVGQLADRNTYHRCISLANKYELNLTEPDLTAF